MLNWIVREGEVSLLTFLKERVKSAPSVKAIKRAIDGRACLVNDRVERFASRKLKKGDRVEFFLEETSEERVSAVKLFEDEYLLAIDKPVGFVCEDKELQKLLPEYKHIWLAHRLDKETSGVLLLAKTPETKERLKQLFSERKIEKRYIALVHGLMLKEEGKIHSTLVVKKRIPGQTIYGSVPAGNGEQASTLWKCLKKGKTTSLLECQPITGRTHQIRVHLSAIGHPVVGDVLYGKRLNEKGVTRCLLHAFQLRFPHPFSGEELQIEATIPEKLFSLSL